jgi:hypothetical protein
MSKRPVLALILIAALTTTSASGQRLGGVRGTIGSVTGAVGGTIGSVGGAVGGTIQSVGGTVGGTVQGTVGGLGGAVGGPVGGTLSQVSSGLAGTVTHVTGRLGATTTQATSGLGTSVSRVSGGYRITGSRIAYRSSPTSGEGAGPVASEISAGDLEQINYLNDLTLTTGYLQLGMAELADLRRLRHEALIRAYRHVLDGDEYGQPVRKGELIAVDPDATSLALVQRAGFRIAADTTSSLGIRMVTLALPKRMNVRKGLSRARQAAPALQVDYNHVYELAGGALLPAMGAALAASKTVKRVSRPAARPPARIAMIDGGIAAHPSLANASIEQRGFAGNPEPTGHGTAVGSLMVGNQGSFRGAARGAQLFVGDVYGGSPAAGSATVVVRAIEWAAAQRPSVINISLVGPHNRALAKAIAALRARGIQVVAAVGVVVAIAVAAFTYMTLRHIPPTEDVDAATTTPQPGRVPQATWYCG